MNRATREYESRIRHRDGTCDCQELVELYESKRALESGVRQADQMLQEADLSRPREEDLPYLEKCFKAHKRKGDRSLEYHLRLLGALQAGVLIAHIHEDGKERAVAHLEGLTEENKRKLQSVHCARCNQQIATFTPNHSR